MKKTIIFMAWALLCHNFPTQGQEKSVDPFQNRDNKANQFMLGTKLPDSFWQDQHVFFRNDSTYKQNLSAYRGKLVILDFWATWCTVCRRKLPLLDSLQKIYPKELAVIPISSIISEDKLENIANVLKGKFKPFITYQLPTIINDERLTGFFPYSQLSHVVWIQEGRILAFTGSDFIDAKLIEKLIMENRIFRLKVDNAKKQKP